MMDRKLKRRCKWCKLRNAVICTHSKTEKKRSKAKKPKYKHKQKQKRIARSPKREPRAKPKITVKGPRAGADTNTYANSKPAPE